MIRAILAATLLPGVSAALAREPTNCMAIHFATGRSSATVRGSVGSTDEPFPCYTLATGKGQTATLKFTKTNGNMAFTIYGLVDDQDGYSFKTEAKTYKFIVFQTLRSTPDPFALQVSVVGASVASAQGATPGGNATGLVGNKPETITILGNTYKIRPDINEDVIWKWSLLEPYLPKELFVKPAKKMSDQEILDFIDKLNKKAGALLKESMKGVVQRHTAEVKKDHPDAGPMDVEFFINDEAFTVNAGGAIGEQPTQDIYNRNMAEFRLMDYLKASINKTAPAMIVH
jgi:hypothetical protein